MPLTPGNSQNTISNNIRELHTGNTYAHTARKFGKAKADKQAVAIALDTARKSEGVANKAIGGAFNMAKAPHLAPSWQEKGLQRKVTRGAILSAVPGRTDAHFTHVPSGSYVIPADIVSGRGQGNTIAGAAKLSKMFKLGGPGPYGSGMPQMSRGKPRFRADGGATDGNALSDGSDNPVRVNLAGGEIVVPPENLRDVVHPNLKTAHDIMDKWVLLERKKLRKTLAKLPGPVRD